MGCGRGRGRVVEGSRQGVGGRTAREAAPGKHLVKLAQGLSVQDGDLVVGGKDA